jgi:NADH dehydrogenase FAD-containing subunit
LKEKCSIGHKVHKVLVVGGGAAGLELAFALRERLKTTALDATISVVDKHRVPLEGSSETLSKTVLAALERAEIKFIPSSPLRCLAQDGKALVLEEGVRLDFDLLVIATGPASHDWQEKSNLLTDDRGFIRVETTLQTSSNPDIFAVGDCASFDK